MSALSNRTDLDSLMPSNYALRKHRTRRHTHQTISNTCLINSVKHILQKMADPLSIIIIDLYLLKHSGDFEKQQLYLAHLEDAVERVQAALDELARVGQVDFEV
jgi:hypothetical protein